mgnify:FL=1
MKKIKVVHYINQFFGQIGGEDKAGIHPFTTDGPVGIGNIFQQESDNRYVIVKTIICGDNYAAENLETVKEQVLLWVKKEEPDLFIAGPAFAAGRYGTSCGTLCQAITTTLKIPAITAMHPVNPGVDIARKDLFIIETGDSAREISSVVPRMIHLADKVLEKKTIGGPEEEGYIPRGIRTNIRKPQRGSRRAVDMLVNKLYNRPYITELPMPVFDTVPPARPVLNMRDAVIAIGTEGGIVPRGNPDRIEAHNASKWCHYSIKGLDALQKGDYEVAHGGYDPVAANENPNRVLPLDAARILEKEKAFARLHNEYPVTVGNVTAVRSAERYGREIGEMLLSQGVHGVILTST